MIEIKAFASGSKGNCYRIDDGSTPLLLECGIPFREIQQKLGFTVSELAGCLVTHEHLDHCKAAIDITRAGIDTYMSAGTAWALAEKTTRSFAGHRVKIVRAKEQFKIGTWTILPFETQHDAAEPLGFLLANGREKILFATDTYYVKYRFQGLTHLMIECNYVLDILEANIANGSVPVAMKRRILRSHMSLESLKGFLTANDLSQVQEIWLLHLSDNNGDARRFKREIQELTGKPVYIASKEV